MCATHNLKGDAIRELPRWANHSKQNGFWVKKKKTSSDEWTAGCFLGRMVWTTALTWAMTGSCWTRRWTGSSPRRASRCSPWCSASSCPSASSTTSSSFCSSANSRSCARRWTCCCWTSASATCWCVCSAPRSASLPASAGSGCWVPAAATGTASSTPASVGPSYSVTLYAWLVCQRKLPRDLLNTFLFLMFDRCLRFSCFYQFSGENINQKDEQYLVFTFQWQRTDW